MTTFLELVSALCNLYFVTYAVCVVVASMRGRGPGPWRVVGKLWRGEIAP